MSAYHVSSHSLSEQVANLADVYSTIPILPVAKAKILREARTGQPSVEGTDVVSVSKLVDGFISYRYGWWGSAVDNTLKKSIQTAWRRRKLRFKMDDESTRTISGRNSNSTALPWSGGTLTSVSAGGTVQIVGHFVLTPVFADGTSPDILTLGSISQDGFQSSMGVSISTIAPVSSSASFTIVFVITLSESNSWFIPTSFSLGTGSSFSPPPVKLVFEVSSSGYSYALSDTGASLTEFPVGKAVLKESVVVDLSKFVEGI